jgi:alkylation response protein AidB-like acyl-CoA dehydrogenase
MGPADTTTRAERTPFRDEVRAWLAAHLTPDLRELGADLSSGEHRRRSWERELGAAGWLGLSWPVEYGGRGCTPYEQLDFTAEYARAGGPVRAPFGESLLGPTLIQFGTDEQKRRFLPPVLRGEQLWCQGFSEPEAGSDLASVRTRARRDGDSWIIDGQKLWSSQATMADWVFVLARTDPAATKHRGLSFLLVPLDQPGVQVRPVRQLTGTSEFSELVFTGARTDADLVVGEPGQGWQIAMATLGYERGTAFIATQIRFEAEFDRLTELARSCGRLADRSVRDRLVDAYVGLSVMRMNGTRAFAELMQSGRPGPESSIGKLVWSQWHQRLGELEMEVLADDGLLVGDDYALSESQHTFMFSRAHTIYAGSSEIQRTIIAERILGLPKEPS